MEHLNIVDVAFGGKGVARSDAGVVFVPFTIDGEEVTVEIRKSKKRFAEADLVSVEKASPHRVEPGCPYFGTCGGCSYQHIDYAHQLALKSRQVGQTLRRVGGLRDVPMKPAVGSPKPYGYRNRIRVHVANGAVGFFAWNKHELVDVERCAIASEQVNDSLQRLRASLMRDGDYTLAEGRGGGFFQQTNDEVTREMLALVQRLVRQGQTLLIDAYCGSGLFAKHLADLFERVVGIEENQYAVEYAQRTALPNETYAAGDVATHLDSILSANDPSRTTLILDPPAIGISARVADSILALPPAELVYVSCDPATLARDLKTLCRSYRLDSVTPLDMFPQTAEIEVAAHLMLTT